MPKKRTSLIFLVSLAALSVALCIYLFSPFLQPILSAIVIAVVFYPIHARIQTVVKNPSIAALISTLLVVLILVVPAALIVLAITNEVREIYVFLDQRSDESGGVTPYLMSLLERPMSWISQYIDLSQIDLRRAALERLQQVGSVILPRLGVIFGNIGSLLLSLTFAFFTLFFMLREGRAVRRRMATILPLNPDQIERLFLGIENTIVATVYGGLVVAAVQGTLVGLMFWILGIPSPVLWGSISSVTALVPLVGTAVIWIPGALYLIATGSWVKALILVGWGAGVVGTVDNLLRPMLISGRVQMHTLLIFFAVLGGVNVFGFLGLFIGPVIVAVTSTLLGMLRDESRNWKLTEASAVEEIGLPPQPVEKSQ